MDTKNQNETPDKKVDATDPQTDAKTTINNQALDDKKIEAKELNETQLDETAAAYSLFTTEPMRYYMRQKKTK